MLSMKLANLLNQIRVDYSSRIGLHQLQHHVSHTIAEKIANMQQVLPESYWKSDYRVKHITKNRAPT